MNHKCAYKQELLHQHKNNFGQRVYNLHDEIITSCNITCKRMWCTSAVGEWGKSMHNEWERGRGLLAR